MNYPNQLSKYHSGATATGFQCSRCQQNAMKVGAAQRLGFDELQNYGNFTRFVRTNTKSKMRHIAGGDCTSIGIANHKVFTWTFGPKFELGRTRESSPALTRTLHYYSHSLIYNAQPSCPPFDRWERGVKLRFLRTKKGRVSD